VNQNPDIRNPQSDIPHPQSPLRPPISDIPPPPSKILVVDDEPSIRITLREFLTRAGYDVDVAEDVERALTLLAGKQHDVVVSDIIMPSVSGVSLLSKIRENMPDVQVLMITGQPTVETAAQAVRAGACDYLVKPVNKDTILRTVANAARIKKLLDEKRRLEADNLQYQKNLEQLVQQRTLELNEALSRLKNAQESLIQQERMNALGQMASGIAHDFNNALMPVVGFSDFLLSESGALDDREGTIDMLKMIRSAGQDAQQIVRRVRASCKPDHTRHSEVNLAQVLESAVELTMPKWKEQMNSRGATVNIVKEFGIVPSIMGSEGELREAFTNLIHNAVDAMPAGGTINLRLKLHDRKTVLCEVSDTGSGMDEMTRRRCLEPFFTTKGVIGTGLGLSMACGIVKRHCGRIEIDSKPGLGTTVQMTFPVSTGSGPSMRETQKSPEEGAVMSNSSSPLLPHGGYEHLRSYKVAQAVYDATVVFCDRFIDKRSRTHDQMMQAARSGVRNISEGSGAAATSRKSEMLLTNVARASLSDELLKDFESFLVQRKLRVWPKDAPETLALRERLKHDLAPDLPPAPEGTVRLTGLSGLADFVAKAEPELAANAMLCATNQAAYLLRRQLESQGRDFVEHGGFAERLHTVRVQARGAKRSDVSDQSDPSNKAPSPACPLCGKAMRQRIAKKGPHAGQPFWGCSGYPECKGTRDASETCDKSDLSDPSDKPTTGARK
jgi:four helix bundle suffix protein